MVAPGIVAPGKEMRNMQKITAHCIRGDRGWFRVELRLDDSVLTTFGDRFDDPPIKSQAAAIHYGRAMLRAAKSAQANVGTRPMVGAVMVHP